MIYLANLNILFKNCFSIWSFEKIRMLLKKEINKYIIIHDLLMKISKVYLLKLYKVQNKTTNFNFE